MIRYRGCTTQQPKWLFKPLCYHKQARQCWLFGGRVQARPSHGGVCTVHRQRARAGARHPAFVDPARIQSGQRMARAAAPPKMNEVMEGVVVALLRCH